MCKRPYTHRHDTYTISTLRAFILSINLNVSYLFIIIDFEPYTNPSGSVHGTISDVDWGKPVSYSGLLRTDEIHYIMIE